MDTQLKKRMTLILTISVMVTTLFLLLQTSQFSFGLCLLSCSYVSLVLFRDHIIKLELHRKVGALFIIFQLILSLVIFVWSQSFFAQVYALILIAEFSFYQSRKLAIIFTLISYVLCILGLLIDRQFPPFDQIFYIFPRAIDYFAIFGISLLAKIAFQQKNQLVRDNEQLRMASIELEKNARLQERTRISRDIHDSVGHTLTSALTGLQTASHAINKHESKLALEMIERTHETILKGLNDVRTSVHLLREDNPDDSFISKLRGFIHGTIKQTQVNITYEIDASIPDLPPMIELTIYRALQEGITNGIRHGASSHFQFALTYQSGLIRFILSNNGKSPMQIVNGFGLDAMKERVGVVGGELTIINSGFNGGVTLDITIPVQLIIEQTG